MRRENSTSIGTSTSVVHRLQGAPNIAEKVPRTNTRPETFLKLAESGVLETRTKPSDSASATLSTSGLMGSVLLSPGS